MLRWISLCPFHASINIVLLILWRPLVPKSCCCILKGTQEGRMSRFSPRYIPSLLQHLITVHVVEGISGRPLACKVDILTFGASVVVIEPFLDFLRHVIRCRHMNAHICD